MLPCFLHTHSPFDTSLLNPPTKQTASSISSLLLRQLNPRFRVRVFDFITTPSMSYNPSPIDLDFESMPFTEVCNKLKRLRLFEPSLAVLGFFLVLGCLICGFFYLDYRTVSQGFVFPVRSERFFWLRNDDLGRNRKVEFLSDEGNGCDVYDGDWVWDDSYPLYHSKNCPFVDVGFRCSENGRPDLFYTKWRWQPKLCNLPRFNATLMLEKMRNKRVVFVGDSIGRNQWESLLCMLSSAVPNKESIYEVNGNPITKHKGFLVFKFKDFNCTIEYYRAPFLVLQSRPPSGASQDVKTTLKLDQMDWSSAQWRDADILVFNTGHWWNYEKTIRGGCYFQEGNEVKMGMRIDDAYQRSLETVMHWINSELDSKKTKVFFRMFAPVHFRGGDWRNGGSCHLEALPELGFSLVPQETWSHFRIANAILSGYQTMQNSTKLEILNVTRMTAQRKDGHSSLYYLSRDVGPASPHRQDCSHWCLPGVPDVWNELLYALFLKHELNSSTSQATQI